MRRWMVRCAVVAAILLSCSLARADDLSACLVEHTNADDRTTLIKWVFAAVSLNPAVKSMITLTPDERDTLNRNAAGLLQRLMIVDCRKETVYAIKTQGGTAIQEAFGVLGKVAMGGLMNDRSVQSGLAVDKYLDTDKFEQLGKEAGDRK